MIASAQAIASAIEAELAPEISRGQEEQPHRFVREMSIWNTRADVAMLSASLWHGVEIKAATDDLRLLRHQYPSYEKYFERVSVAVAGKHLPGVEAMLPDWWGIALVRPRTDERGHHDGGIMLEWHRPPQSHPGVQARLLAGLLWRDEMWGLCAEHCLKVRKSWTRAQLQEVILEHFDLPQLQAAVTGVLLTRQDWLVRAGFEEPSACG